MGDLTTLNNACGYNLLRLVARGNAIIAELLRLKDYIPSAFRLNSKQLQQKYGPIIIDFVYFKAVQAHEKKIESDAFLQEVDEELRSNFSEILTRFYLAFESVHKYVVDLNSYIDELEDGHYIQQSLETVILNQEGKQLLCESLYLYGTMLLVVDCYYDGQTRERILVSYYRYNAQISSCTRVDDVCMLLRSTGYIKFLNKRPINYPEAYFQRIPLNETFVDLAISRLRADEIYNQTRVFPHPDHRSVALANQASMLAIILFFKPMILNNQPAVMREIVDKFFPDTWVISVYMGIIIDLWDWWSPYKAAKSALNNTLESSNLRKVSQLYGQRMEKHLKKIDEPHLELKLDEAAIGHLIKLIKECNVTLHWILLHSASPTFLIEDSKRSKSFRPIVMQESKCNLHDSLKLLLGTAKLENHIKQMYKQILQDKDSKWEKNKDKCIQKIEKLADVFSGNKQLAETEQNLNLGIWFIEIKKKIEILNKEDGKTIIQLVQALEEVQEFHQLENNLQVSQYLFQTKEILHKMLYTSNMSEETMISLNLITDCCYAWNIMESFVPTMQSLIKHNPDTVIKLKTLFIKMASALEMPLLRINQAHSSDLTSVSQYYSRELESFARRVLQIIPESVFGILASIVKLETNVFREIPTKLPKDKICEYAQLKERLNMAKLTYTISIYTKGMLALRSVSLGVLRVDSHRLLEDGIRQELFQRITSALHETLVFDGKSKVLLMSKLQSLSNIMDGHRRAFQYIQDYISINSLKIWHEEITYIINSAVDQECNSLSWIPGTSRISLDNKMSNQFIPTDINSFTFIGRLMRELIRITDPKTTIYIEHTLAWYDLKNQEEVLSHKVFTMILNSIETPGLSGLDKMLSHFISLEIQKIIKFLLNGIKNKIWKGSLQAYEELLKNVEYQRNQRVKLSSLISIFTHKTWPQLLDHILKIGHLQILRNKITYELNTACKFEAKHMEAALRSLNEALLLEINKSHKSTSADLVQELNLRLHWAGIMNVMDKIYLKTPKLDIDSIFFMFTMNQLTKMVFSRNIAAFLSRRISDPIDAVVFTVGIQSVLKQFSIDQFDNYYKRICEFVLTFGMYDSFKLNNDIEPEAANSIHYLELLKKQSLCNASFLKECIPSIILEQYQANIAIK